MAPTFPPKCPQITTTKFTHNLHIPKIHSHTNALIFTQIYFAHIHRAAKMVVALGPGKFYGSSLPRPRIYTDVKLNDERIDPPLPVMDPLMMWAQEAHWSMGGLSFTRLRLQGRIEGNVNKLRVQREKLFKKSQKQQKPVKGSTATGPDKDKNSRVGQTPSPPPAPMVIKRRRVVGLVEEDGEEAEEDEEGQRGMKRGAARKLGDDFERVARESGIDGKKATNGGGEGGGMVAARTRSKRNMADVVVNEKKVNKIKKKLVEGRRKVGASVVAAAPRIRTSPRLVKVGGSS
ncbi:hypothetical protein Pfo_025089 [Paulownia fortunei]|nr:hypothetical protein Pfo_025089 [Paulownia fortunei]